MRYCFGPFTLDADNRWLVYRNEDNGQEGSLQLEPRCLDVYIQLVSKPGQLLTYDDIYSAVWDDGSDDDDRNYLEAVSKAISDIRHALGDNYKRPTYIETVRSQGYRFVHPVTTKPALTDPGPCPPPIPSFGTVSPRELLRRFGQIRSGEDRLLLYLVLAKEEKNFQLLCTLANRSEEELAQHLLSLIEGITEPDDFTAGETPPSKFTKAWQRLIVNLKKRLTKKSGDINE